MIPDWEGLKLVLQWVCIGALQVLTLVLILAVLWSALC